MIESEEVSRPDESSALLAEAESNPTVRMRIQENILLTIMIEMQYTLTLTDYRLESLNALDLHNIW